MSIPRKDSKDEHDTSREGRPAAPESGPVAEDTPGTNATQHAPNPREQPIPDPGGEHKYHPESPYTTGNY